MQNKLYALEAICPIYLYFFFIKKAIISYQGLGNVARFF